jgi:crossover junction endodeoxyribonuclease RusA
MTELKLPYPPTANSIWRSGRRRTYRSEKYRAWLSRASWEAKLQCPGKVIGPYELTMRVSRPDKRKRDLDNLLKPISDLLCTIGVIEDDSLCRRILAEWITEGDGMIVRIEPTV